EAAGAERGVLAYGRGLVLQSALQDAVPHPPCDQLGRGALFVRHATQTIAMQIDDEHRVFLRARVRSNRKEEDARAVGVKAMCGSIIQGWRDLIVRAHEVGEVLQGKRPKQLARRK